MTMPVRRILLDLDGVLVDFVGGVCKLLDKPNPYHEAKNLGKYDLAPLLGISNQWLWAPLGFEFWASLEPLPGWRMIVHAAENYVGPSNVCLLTSPPNTRGAAEGKREWIRRHLPDYQRRSLIGSAKEFCASPAHLLVDDYPANISRFEAAGGHGLLVPGPWNHRHREDPTAVVRDALA